MIKKHLDIPPFLYFYFILLKKKIKTFLRNNEKKMCAGHEDMHAFILNLFLKNEQNQQKNICRAV